MVDFFIDRMAKKTVAEWVLGWDKEPRAEIHLFETWKAMTRTMFWRFPAIQVYDIIDECLAEASNEQYFKEKIHQLSAEEVPKIEQQVVKSKGKYRKIIDSKLKIIDVAKGYGLEVNSKRKTLCPFHADGDPSLSFNNEKNIFNCFGCGVKGDIIEFIRLMEEERGSTGSNK